MEGKSTRQQLKEIYKALQDYTKVNLFGPPGVGKTWMAKRASALCNRNGTFAFTLWAFLSREYDYNTLSESIDRQLCLFPTPEEWEAVDESDGIKVIVEGEDPETLAVMFEKTLKGKKVLLVLDDVLDDEAKRRANEEKFWSAWEKMLPRNCKVETTVLLISRSSREDEGFLTIKIEALLRADSNSLLRAKLDTQLRQHVGIQTLGEKFIEKSDCFPGTVTMIAKALSYFGVDPSGISMLEKELEELEESEKYNVNRLLTRKHNVLPIGVLKDLWWRGHHLFRDKGSVHYNELITYWILEGYIGSGSISKLYEKSHHILVELMDCGILKDQESGYLFMDKSLLNVDNLYQCLEQIASLGLATVFKNDTEGFGSIIYDDGMLKTPLRNKTQNQEQGESSDQGGRNLSTLLLDGTHHSEKVLLDFLQSENELEILALFNPTLKSFPKPLDMMDRLQILVLRGCAYLKDVDLPLKDLRVLEISGAGSLSEMKNEFFDKMRKLQSLNLSALQITSLPDSIYNLVELQWLVIKNCPHLKEVGKLAKLEQLLVLDLSGNISLEYVDDNFLNFKRLQSLNLSNTMVTTTPLFRNIDELTHLLLRDCKNLGMIRGLASLYHLVTLDLSGSTNFEWFYDPSLEKLVSLRTLDLSGTSLERLPSNISNPRRLYLKNCFNLQKLSCFDFLVDLEILDLSGSKNLNYIEDDFFDHMTHLRVLDLSETNISSLPSFYKLSNLRELFLSHCKFLRELPSLESVTKLEVLDVSNSSALEDIGNPSFEGMNRLQKLDLSDTMIIYLPTLRDPSNLRQLIMKNCTNLQKLELNASLLNLEVLNLSGVTSFASDGAEFVKDMSNLQILDLSCTSLEQLPPMSKLKNLNHLSVAGCRSLETIPDLNHLSKLETLDLSGSSVKRLPKFSSSNNLRKLLVKDCSLEENFQDLNVSDL